MIEYTVKVGNDGSRMWFLNGKRHREDGPAVEHPDGYKEWRFNGKVHREDGPAVEYASGKKEWWLDDCYVSEEEHRQQAQICSGKIVEIDGKKYKLTEV